MISLSRRKLVVSGIAATVLLSGVPSIRASSNSDGSTGERKMKQVQCIRVKLRPEAADEMVAWMRNLNGRMNEVLAAIADEAIFVETAFLQTEGADRYLYLYTVA